MAEHTNRHFALRLAILVAVILTVFGGGFPKGEAAEPPGEIPRVTWSPVGRQFLLVGGRLGFWLGSGQIRALPEGDATTGPLLAEVSLDRAYPIGPIMVGLAHVVADSIHFEARVGIGAVVFENDRLIDSELKADGGAHVGVALEAEILGRYVFDSGFTAAFALNFGSVGLPNERGALLRPSPRVGYLDWAANYRSFFLVEVGYQFPFINGLEPDVRGALTSPIDSSWHMMVLSATWGY